MKNVYVWSRVLLRLSPRLARVAAAICLVAALTPASALAQAGRVVIDSFNGSGLTLRAHVNGILRQNKLVDGVADAPHQNFWDKLNYSEFTTGNVPGVDAGPKPPYRILIVGDGANSNLVMALQGKGPLFNKDNGEFGRMPANAEPPGAPYFTDAEIQPIIDFGSAGAAPRGT